MKCKFSEIERECSGMECIDCLCNMHEQQHIIILNLKDKIISKDHAINRLIVSVNKLRDKVQRRNMQIKDLKERKGIDLSDIEQNTILEMIGYIIYKRVSLENMDYTSLCSFKNKFYR